MADAPGSFEEAQRDPNYCMVCGEYHESVETVRSHGRAAQKMSDKYGVSI